MQEELPGEQSSSFSDCEVKMPLFCFSCYSTMDKAATTKVHSLKPVRAFNMMASMSLTIVLMASSCFSKGYCEGSDGAENVFPHKMFVLLSNKSH
jgi:hypothetical protein